MNWTFSSFSFFNLRKLYKFNHVTFHDNWYTSLCQIAEYDLISFFWAETLPQHSQALCSIHKLMIPELEIGAEIQQILSSMVGLLQDIMSLLYVRGPRERFCIILALGVRVFCRVYLYSVTRFSHLSGCMRYVGFYHGACRYNGLWLCFPDKRFQWFEKICKQQTESFRGSSQKKKKSFRGRTLCWCNFIYSEYWMNGQWRMFTCMKPYMAVLNHLPQTCHYLTETKLNLIFDL